MDNSPRKNYYTATCESAETNLKNGEYETTEFTFKCLVEAESISDAESKTQKHWKNLYSEYNKQGLPTGNTMMLVGIKMIEEICNEIIS